MNYLIAIQNTLKKDPSIPNNKKLREWATLVLTNKLKSAEVCLRIVDETEGKNLNQEFRNKSYATNVLSFPMDDDLSGIYKNRPYIGDVVLCSPVIFQEANEQNKSLEMHWAHMVIHGLLHLLGYDHIGPDEAEVMEKLEKNLLKHLGFTDPYRRGK